MTDLLPLLFDSVPVADLPSPRDGFAASPIGRRRSPPPSRRRSRPRPSTAALLAQLAERLDRQHRETVAALDRLSRLGRTERETLPAVLRQLTEIRRTLGLTALHRPERHTRRRPTGTSSGTDGAA